MIIKSIQQKFLPDHPENIDVRCFPRHRAEKAVKRFCSHLNEGAHVGLAMQHKAGRLIFVALATVQQVFIIEWENILPNVKPSELLCDKLLKDFLQGNSYTLVGFDLARLALHIAHDLKFPFRGVDLSTAFQPDNWGVTLPSKVIQTKLTQEVDAARVDDLWMKKGSWKQELSLRAWLAVCVAERCKNEILHATRVDTQYLNPRDITVLSELVKQAYVMDNSRPKETSGEFSTFSITGDGGLELQNSRYKTRVRRSNQTVIMTNESDIEFKGHACGAKGRTTNIRFNGPTLSGTLTSVRVSGPPSLTNPEKARDELILNVLHGQVSLDRSPFIRLIWSDNQKAQDFDSLAPLHEETAFSGLNASQEAVATRMLSGEPLLIVHGPPGTGKTTTIAASVSVWAERKLPTWIVAHSNVAVKNIAETLSRKGVYFRILVSKEFHFEWHEHIYSDIQDRVIVSDEVLGLKDLTELARVLGPTCVMLSTLSMLSNPSLHDVGLFNMVPVGRLVVDEASQIIIEDFLPIFSKFRTTLEKVCFFGDPKQLPPYGKDQLRETKTIFDIPHLQHSAGFLDTQYRMPTPLGDFISKHVYSERLKSVHDIQTASCLLFVDVPNGVESKSGFSWTNPREIQVMVNIVKTYYKHLNFCIITPYDAQRSAIERQLKAENLPWERVFNVDSFQGNEADFVLVSVVRSGNIPGFLSSENRMNVLLTRCRKGLVIVTSRSFIRGGGQDTLLGSLERHWTETQGSNTWTDRGAILEKAADLPGAPGPNRVQATSVQNIDISGGTPSRAAPDKENTFSAKNTQALGTPAAVLKPITTSHIGIDHPALPALPGIKVSSVGDEIPSPSADPLRSVINVLPVGGKLPSVQVHSLEYGPSNSEAK